MGPVALLLPCVPPEPGALEPWNCRHGSSHAMFFSNGLLPLSSPSGMNFPPFLDWQPVTSSQRPRFRFQRKPFLSLQGAFCLYV